MLHQRHSEDMFRLGKSEHESRRGGGPHLPFAANGCSLTWSNGMVEGFVNKVKWIKRSSYGQAGFPLLQPRILLHPAAPALFSKDQRRHPFPKSASPPFHEASCTGSTPMTTVAA